MHNALIFFIRPRSPSRPARGAEVHGLCGLLRSSSLPAGRELQSVACAVCTQAIITAPMPLTMWSWLPLRRLRRNDVRRKDFGTSLLTGRVSGGEPERVERRFVTRLELLGHSWLRPGMIRSSATAHLGIAHANERLRTHHDLHRFALVHRSSPGREFLKDIPEFLVELDRSLQHRELADRFEDDPIVVGVILVDCDRRRCEELKCPPCQGLRRQRSVRPPYERFS